LALLMISLGLFHQFCPAATVGGGVPMNSVFRFRHVLHVLREAAVEDHQVVARFLHRHLAILRLAQVRRLETLDLSQLLGRFLIEEGIQRKVAFR